MAIGGRLSEADARRQLEQTDRIRSLYWRRLYKRDIADSDYYHLIIDSTVLDLGVVRDLIITGARAFWEAKAAS
jgi:cytidylate kinase